MSNTTNQKRKKKKNKILKSPKKTIEKFFLPYIKVSNTMPLILAQLLIEVSGQV
jgi:hypothetical protein